MDQSISINIPQCRKIAEKISELTPNPYVDENEYITLDVDHETKLRYFLFSSAICHQTHTLLNPITKKKGWDYLSGVYVNLAKENSRLLDPKYLAGLSNPELIEEFRILFSYDKDPKNCSLDRLDERAGFIIGSAKIITEKYDGKVENLFIKGKGYLISDGHGIYELLEEFPVFQDPQRKKSTLIVNFIVKSKLFEIKDKENIAIIMDYHIQRLLLRTGAVTILDERLKEKLTKNIPLVSDHAVRSACIEASKKITQFAKKDALLVHDIFWSLGRSCCNKNPLCVSKTCSRTPCTFLEYFDVKIHDDCFLTDSCKGNADSGYRNLWQPNVETNYY